MPLPIPKPKALSAQLFDMLFGLFGTTDLHLDHDPPLGAREKIWKDGEIVGYKPDANDPEYLVYRLKVDHQLKTNVRGEHGQHPDRVLIKKQRRRERKAQRRPKQKIRSANRWAKGRKVQWWKKEGPATPVNGPK